MHVPYRNSKVGLLLLLREATSLRVERMRKDIQRLTTSTVNILRYSMGDDSKMLMFVMISLLKRHLNKTVTKLGIRTKGQLGIPLCLEGELSDYPRCITRLSAQPKVVKCWERRTEVLGRKWVENLKIGTSDQTMERLILI